MNDPSDDTIDDGGTATYLHFGQYLTNIVTLLPLSNPLVVPEMTTAGFGDVTRDPLIVIDCDVDVPPPLVPPPDPLDPPLPSTPAGVHSDLSAPQVNLTGPIALCFNSAGRQVGNPAPGVTGAACMAGVAGALTRYEITGNGADRALRVTVSPGGHIRMCDPARALAAGVPDGCPA